MPLENWQWADFFALKKAFSLLLWRSNEDCFPIKTFTWYSVYHRTGFSPEKQKLELWHNWSVSAIVQQGSTTPHATVMYNCDHLPLHFFVLVLVSSCKVSLFLCKYTESDVNWCQIPCMFTHTWLINLNLILNSNSSSSEHLTFSFLRHCIAKPCPSNVTAAVATLWSQRWWLSPLPSTSDSCENLSWRISPSCWVCCCTNKKKRLSPLKLHSIPQSHLAC